MEKKTFNTLRIAYKLESIFPPFSHEWETAQEAARKLYREAIESNYNYCKRFAPCSGSIIFDFELIAYEKTI